MSSAPTNPVLRTPTDVCLVQMPYASLERPSIALSILKAALTGRGIDSSIVYGNILFAEKIGAHIYDIINKSQSHTLAGEWTFAPACFPDFDPDHQGYFAHTRYGLESLQPLVAGLGSPLAITTVLEKVRAITPAFVDEMARLVLSLKPRIVGCSSTFQQHCASLALLRRIKELDSQVITVIGGANCEASMGVVTHQQCPWVDYVVSGEGDLVFPDLVAALLAGETPSATAASGVIAPAHREGLHYAMLEIAPPRAKLQRMADSPMPDYDDYFAFLAHSDVGRYIKPGLLMETSRGCWWGAISHCTFCGLNGESMSHRSKSQERVLEEINELTSKYGITSVEVVDNILEMEYFKHFIPQLALQDTKFDIFYETKANLNRDKLRKLASAGIRWLQPGIESLDNTILNMIGKGTSTRVNLQLMKWAMEEGIYVLWIMLYDLPGEDDGIYLRMAEWLPLVSHLQPPSGLSFIQINRFSPYQMQPAKYGITLSADRSYSYVYPWPQASIDNFAYYFDDYSHERPLIDYQSDKPTSRPGLDKLKEVMLRWQNDWARRQPQSSPIEQHTFSLLFKEHDATVTVYDTRSCAVNSHYELCGLERALFLACDSFRTLSEITEQMQAFDDAWTSTAVDQALSRLCACKLLLLVDGRYFTLAVRYSHNHLPTKANYPGGRLLSKVEVKIRDLMELANATLSSF